MLTKTESKLMQIIYAECQRRGALLITPYDLINMSGEKGLTESTLEKMLDELNLDGYFDLVYTDRHGERVFCITLTEKGKGFNRNRKVFKRNLIFRIALTVALAVLSFVTGIILKAIFK